MWGSLELEEAKAHETEPEYTRIDEQHVWACVQDLEGTVPARMAKICTGEIEGGMRCKYTG